MGFYLHVFGGSTYFLFDSSAEPGPSVSCPWWSFRHQPVKMAKKHPRWSWPSSQPSFLCWCQCCIWDSTKPWGVKPPILVGWRPGQNNYLKKIWRPMFDGSQIINYCRSIFGHIGWPPASSPQAGIIEGILYNNPWNDRVSIWCVLTVACSRSYHLPKKVQLAMQVLGSRLANKS